MNATLSLGVLLFRTFWRTAQKNSFQIISKLLGATLLLPYYKLPFHDRITNFNINFHFQIVLVTLAVSSNAFWFGGDQKM